MPTPKRGLLFSAFASSCDYLAKCGSKDKSVIGISSVLGPSGQGCILFSAFSSLPIGLYINRVLVDSVEAFAHLFN